VAQDQQLTCLKCQKVFIDRDVFFDVLRLYHVNGMEFGLCWRCRQIVEREWIEKTVH